MRIVKRLTNDVLSTIASTGALVYTEQESAFLSMYAPYAFLGKTDSERARKEASIKLIDRTITLEVALAQGVNPEQLIRQKLDKINVVFHAFDEQPILATTPLSTLIDMKYRSLAFAKETTPAYTLCNRQVETTSFQDARRTLIGMYGNIPMLVYGSAVLSNNPNDIDVLVFPDRVDEELLHSIQGRLYNSRLSSTVMPIDHLTTLLAHDDGQHFTQGASLLLNGTIAQPEFDEKHTQEIQLQGVALDYIALRESLLPERQFSVVKIMQGKVKLAKFIQTGLQLCTKTQLPNMAVPNYRRESPSMDMHVEHLQRMNLYANTVLAAFLDAQSF